MEEVCKEIIKLIAGITKILLKKFQNQWLKDFSKVMFIEWISKEIPKRISEAIPNGIFEATLRLFAKN